MISPHILAAVGEERTAQTVRWGNAHDDQHSMAEWVALLSRHVGLAMPDGAAPDVEAIDCFRRQMIRTAALAIAALDALDRKGLWSRPAVLTQPGPDF